MAVGGNEHRPATPTDAVKAASGSVFLVAPVVAGGGRVVPTAVQVEKRKMREKNPPQGDTGKIKHAGLAVWCLVTVRQEI